MDKGKDTTVENTNIAQDDFHNIVLSDFQLACESREASLLGRREVLTGKAKFGIFGDGKELAQIALAKQFRKGDFRSGYYRDQTWMLHAGIVTLQQFFAQLYAHTDVDADPSSAGRQMNGHYGNRTVNDDGTWKDLTLTKNSSSDISPTAGQMPRLVGLAYASKFYRENKALASLKGFSNGGNEVAFGSIGDSSTSEGPFWEAINAAGVLQIPLVMSCWDDGHGISVPKKFQTTKESISEILAGFQRNNKQNGYEIFKTKGWDYAHLCETYEKAAHIARTEHVPVFVHVEEVTQPQGHSTSGSHERYKSKERLEWEVEYDPITKMRRWIIDSNIATEEQVDTIASDAKKTIRDAKKAAWNSYLEPIKTGVTEVSELCQAIASESEMSLEIESIVAEMQAAMDPDWSQLYKSSKHVLRVVRNERLNSKQALQDWLTSAGISMHDKYNSHLHSESQNGALSIKSIAPEYATEQLVDAREIIRDNFDAQLRIRPEVMIFGEDSGKIGGVNQGLENLQSKHGELRVFDTGIRECTIIGQGIGLAMRGLRPIAEIQYLDYLLYAVQVLSDDLATLQYRTKGGQRAPLIIRTRGHRLEGIWHSGSPLGMIINALRGIYVCVPRNMTQAAGFYNTLLESDDCALVIESLNGYRLKEKLPSNVGEFKIALGHPEVLIEGTDVTLVTYGSMVRMAVAVAEELKKVNISIEVIDVQTLLPFDIDASIVASLKKTNRVIFVDEDVPGGATAFMMQKVLEEQDGYQFLDSSPKTLTAKEHRAAYGTDGDYFSKPNNEDIFDAVYDMMTEADPEAYPRIY